MRGERSTDPAELLLGALADEIADRLASHLARQLAEIVEAGGLELMSQDELAPSHRPAPATTAEHQNSRNDGLWTAGRVAAHYQVTVRFVYQHADELGCIRLGGGRRPRLRFDRHIVRERWPVVGDTLPEPVNTRRRARTTTSEERRHGRMTYELIEYEEP
jgi:hypothetical protein